MTGARENLRLGLLYTAGALLDIFFGGGGGECVARRFFPVKPGGIKSTVTPVSQNLSRLVVKYGTHAKPQIHQITRLKRPDTSNYTSNAQIYLIARLKRSDTAARIKRAQAPEIGVDG